MSDNSEFLFQTLIDALLDEDTIFDPRYLHRLSDLEDEDLAALLEVWPKVSLERRQALLEDLNELGAADDMLSFENLGRHVIQDQDPQVRFFAVQLLWGFEGRDLIPVYLELLKSDPDPEVRAASASGLGLFVYQGEMNRLPVEKLKEIEDLLLEAVHRDHSPQVKYRALESLGYSSSDEIAPLIETAFTTGDHDSMASALIAMGRSMDPRWEKAILQMLNSKIPVLRAEAARAAGEIEIKDSIPELVELTTDSEEIVRSAAIWSLSEIGGDQARHTLEMLFRETDYDQEADFLETALDNLAFTHGMEPFSLFDFPEESPEDELLEMLISQDSSREKNGNGASDADWDAQEGDSITGDEFLDEDEDFQA